MPHPCSYWAVRTFGKTDPNRTTFESITEITDAFRAELTSEEEKLGRPALPKLVYEPIENDQVKKKPPSLPRLPRLPRLSPRSVHRRLMVRRRLATLPG